MDLIPAPCAPHSNRGRDERGASATEYGLLVVAIAAIIVVIVFALGGVVKETFSKGCTSIRSGASTSANCT